MNTISTVTSPSAKETAPSAKSADLPRNQYGALNTSAVLDADGQEQLRKLLARAIEQGLLKAPFITSSAKEMESLNHDIFDVQVVRGRVRSVAVQARTFWRHLRKNRSRLTKEYCLLTVKRGKVSSQPLDSATCTKRAKNTTKLGQLVAHYTGGKTLGCRKPAVHKATGYKVLVCDANCTLSSVYDDSVYRPGVWRSQAALPDHGGGFYFYKSRQFALAAMRHNETFGDGWEDERRMVLCEVEVAGREVEYADYKFAASRLRVVQILEDITPKTLAI